MMEQKEAHIIGSVLAGDTERFALLVDRYGERLFDLLLRLVGEREEAEELMQDVFVKAYTKLSSYRGDSEFGTWLYRIGYNSALSFLRRRKRTWVRVDGSLLDTVTDETVEAFFSYDQPDVELIERVQQAIEKLLPDEQAVVLLFYYDDRSVADIAAITSLSAANVKVKLHRARKKLYGLLNCKLPHNE